ncbi:response regulator transcription factor [Umezawaea sp. Da 62-37]|uniref:response regulator transcription factor n=1 Tax=Umezawaea sp. Da 62-37 TaxID=3075927 RepID=UPI0028F6D10C|nr:response regulator transcription factor [Umezawaea sp. Da 62-37]WNV85230.1 response regulator transcription factor [Umezawaea sp. Da 62-37]
MARVPEQGCGAVRLSVMLADIHPAVRHGVRFVLESEGIDVVSEAATADEVLAEVVRHQPDVLMVDYEFDGNDGVWIIGQVLRLVPGTGVLVFSAAEDDTAITTAFTNGARGYLTKNAHPDQILRGIRAVAAGEAIVSKAIAGRLGALLRLASGQTYPFPQLSVREREVLECLAAGMTNGAIARELRLAPKTISNRVSGIFGKLSVADRMQAIVMARDAGLGQRERSYPDIICP